MGDDAKPEPRRFDLQLDDETAALLREAMRVTGIKGKADTVRACLSFTVKNWGSR